MKKQLFFTVFLCASFLCNLLPAQCVYTGFPSNAQGGFRPIVYGPSQARCWEACSSCDLDSLGDNVLALVVPPSWHGVKIEFVGLDSNSAITVLGFGCEGVIQEHCGVVDSIVIGGDTAYTIWLSGPIGDTLDLFYTRIFYNPGQVVSGDCCTPLSLTEEVKPKLPESFWLYDPFRGILTMPMKPPLAPGMYYSTRGRKIIVTQ